MQANQQMKKVEDDSQVLLVTEKSILAVMAKLDTRSCGKGPSDTSSESSSSTGGRCQLEGLYHQ